MRTKHIVVAGALALAAAAPAGAFLGVDNAGQGAMTGALIGGIAGGGRGAAIGAMTGMAVGGINESEQRRRREEYYRRQQDMRMQMEHQRQMEQMRMQQEMQRAREAEWRRQQQTQMQPQGFAPMPAAPAQARGGDLVADTQRSLTVLGYNPGGVDGKLGPATVAALKQYQSDHGLLVTGRASPELLSHMRAKGG